MKTESVVKIVEKYNCNRSGLISILEEIQSEYGYLPAEALRIVAKELGCSLTDIFGVATFYKSFNLNPRGKHLISVCLGTACHVRGGPNVSREFERQLGVRAGETTPDKEYTLETVNCLGACAIGPVVVVDGHYFSNVSIAKVKKILEKAEAGLDTVEIKTDERIFPVEVSCPKCNHSFMDPKYLVDGFPSIKITAAFNSHHGWLRLSGLYGSYSVESEHKIPVNSIVNFFCPHCHTELTGGNNCPECESPMVPMIVRGGGMVQICSRRGCKGHMLDLNYT